MPSALVTGASGHLGQHIVKELDRLGWEYHAPPRRDLNLLRAPEATDYLSPRSGMYDYIFHAATVPLQEEMNDCEFFEKNIILHTNMVRIWREFLPMAKMVTFGSSAAYSDKQARIPANYLTGEPEERYKSHAHAKRQLLLLLRTAAQNEHEYVYLIPCSIYGPGFKLTDTHLVHHLIRKYVDAKMFGGDIPTLWGDGSQERQVLYAPDAAREVVRLCQKLTNKAINLCPRHEWTVNQLANMVCDECGYDISQTIYDEEKAVGFLHNRYMPPQLPIKEETQTRVAVTETIKWYIAERQKTL